MKTWTFTKKYWILVVFFFSSLCLLSPFKASAQGPSRIAIDTTSPQKLTLLVGKSLIIRSSEQVKRVSVVAPEIADALVLTPWQISLMGKAPGITNVTLWGLENKVFSILDVEVSPDVSRLEEMLRKIFPEEPNIRVSATHDNITLSGTVSSSSKRDQILSLAEPYFPKKVVDLLKVQASNTDVSRLEAMIQKVIPDEKDIWVTATDDKVALSGRVSTKAKSDQILALAESYFPKKVINLLQIEALQAPPELSLRVKESLHEILPEEKDIKITSMEGNITLSGTVSSASSLSQAVKLSESFLPKDGKVINLLEVAGVQQVMLEVRVAEMSRSLLRRLGFNLTYLSSSGKNLGLTLLNRLTQLPSEGFPAKPLLVSDKITGIFRFTSLDTSWTFFVDALKEDGLLKVLAEPTLITLSGKTANFLAGGEFPIPVPQASGVSTTITVEYKPFGVGLNFTPVVLSNNKINMQVSPEVSELDFSNAVNISGFIIPALTTRRVSTVIELGDGQSFAIAGLLKDEVREIIGKFPVLGDIPVLGPLFRSSSYQKNETELIVIVTPHLVKPLDRAKQTLPTDQFIDPDDYEFYILGLMEGREKTKSLSPSPSSSSSNQGLKLEGTFGHIVPK